MSAPKILSPQAILVSLAIHAIVVGVLFSVGVSKDDSLQESAKNPPAQAVAEKVSPEKVQETPPPVLEKKDEQPQKEVAQKLGISQSYISRLEKRTMQKLKKEMLRQTSCA